MSDEPITLEEAVERLVEQAEECESFAEEAKREGRILYEGRLDAYRHCIDLLSRVQQPEREYCGLCDRFVHLPAAKGPKDD